MMTLDRLCVDIKKRYSETNSWRKTAEPLDIFPSMARLIANGYNPGKKIRKKLGLQEIATVVVIEGEAPNGTLAHSAQRCHCGQWYISNHPRRHKCFICSPYKGKKGN